MSAYRWLRLTLLTGTGGRAGVYVCTSGRALHLALVWDESTPIVACVVEFCKALGG
jgi:hypothetical protein